MYCSCTLRRDRVDTVLPDIWTFKIGQMSFISILGRKVNGDVIYVIKCIPCWLWGLSEKEPQVIHIITSWSVSVCVNSSGKRGGNGKLLTQTLRMLMLICHHFTWYAQCQIWRICQDKHKSWTYLQGIPEVEAAEPTGSQQQPLLTQTLRLQDSVSSPSFPGTARWKCQQF